MNTPLKVLMVHGLGDHRGKNWNARWERAIVEAFPNAGGLKLDVVPLNYDDIFFDQVKLSARDYVVAIGKLVGSALFGPDGSRGARGDLGNKFKTTVGYVVAWVENKRFHEATRKRVWQFLEQHQPDVILAHSLGSLVTYNAFTDPSLPDGARKALERAVYVSFGSQLGSRFVIKNLTSGRLVMPRAEHWFHLYNRLDDIFTKPISLPGEAKFTQLHTPFDSPGWEDHDPEYYLAHATTVENLWWPLANPASNGPGSRSLGAKSLTAPRPPKRRALLVGINRYAGAVSPLDGCVNDVFLTSALLQECGWDPEHIRVVLDDRATASAIHQRLEWLLDDPRPGDELVFYFSGHGARMPVYGPDGETSHFAEILVAHDFAWTRETGIMDESILELYSQLPFGVHFAVIFDCCHSGGMHRSGQTVRGVEPPDDIRHRALRWNSKPDRQRWEPRDLGKLNERIARGPRAAEFMGQSGQVSRLGRALAVRPDDESEAAPASADGPYMPLILQACSESEFAFEYRHGVISYGAFTYSLA